jgi:hypothetical protein
MKSVITILTYSRNIIPLNVIPLGHPTGEDKPKGKVQFWKNSQGNVVEKQIDFCRLYTGACL